MLPIVGVVASSVLNAPPAAPSFPTLSGTVTARYDVASEVAYSNGNPVGTLTDQSGNGRHATASGGARPTYVTNQYGTLPALRFSGSNWMATPSMTRYAVALVASITAWDSGGFITVIGENFDNDRALRREAGQNNWRNIFGWTIRRDGVATNATGAPPQSLSVYTFDAASDTDVMNIGANLGGTVNWHGDINEIIVMNAAFTGADRALLEAHLKAKWGTP